MLCKLGAVQACEVYQLFFKTLFSRYCRHHVNVPDVKVFNRIHGAQSLGISLG